MGRYLESWDDAQSRGSSRNGGRGGEAEVHISPLFCRVTLQRSREIIRIVTLNPHCVGFCHDIVRQFTCCSPNSQGVYAYFNTATQTDASHITACDWVHHHVFDNNLVVQLDRRACECEISLVYLVKFQSELFSLVFLMHHLCREENGESPF